MSDVYRRAEMMRFRPKFRALFAFQFLMRPGFVMNVRTSMAVPFQ